MIALSTKNVGTIGHLYTKKRKKIWLNLMLYSKIHSKSVMEYSLEGLMLKLKLQYFGHLTRRPDSFKKILMLEKIAGGRRRGHRGWDGWMASLTQWTWIWVSSGSWWWTGRPGVLQSMGLQRVGHNWATELNWTEYQKKKKKTLAKPHALY